MNIELIFEVSHATLGGTMSFPDAVGKLMGAGVEYYHVDYVRLRKTFYSAEGRTELEQKGTKQTEAFSFSDSGKSLSPLSASVENSSLGQTLTVPIAFDALPPVAPELDVAALRANILDSQRNGQPFREFTRRAMAGGVQGYIAFLRGKRVMYWGRNGEQHVEWFPGAKPTKN
jgi:uncharacterized protein YbcV (DUF1398 family)